MGCDMRDFRDAKAMATSLRQALTDKSVTFTHSDCLELVSKAFGLDNWNILAAKIEAERPSTETLAPATPDTTSYCSFCGKPQQAVEVVIAGPDVFICNECVGLCDNILVDKKLGREIAAARARRPDVTALEAAAETLAVYADGQLEGALKSSADWLEHIDWSLVQIEAALSGKPRTPWRPDETALRRGWTRDPLAGRSLDEIAKQETTLKAQQREIRERLDLLTGVLSERAGRT
jgi:hypothetical protein